MSKLYWSDVEAEKFANQIDNSFENVKNFFLTTVRKKCGKSGNERMDMMVDVGCGSGGSTRMFAPYFKSIIAFDPSDNQIALAKKITCAENITYLVGSGEDMPVSDECADMILSCWSIHCIEIDKFVSECKRVLKPNGQCFAYGYDYTEFTMVGGEIQAASVQDVYNRYCERIDIFYKENFPKIKKHNDRFQSIFDKITGLKKTRIDTLTHQSNVISLWDFKTRLLSIPEYRKCSEFEKGEGRSDPMENLIRDIKTIWKVVDKDEKEIHFRFTFSFYVLCLCK